MVRAGLDYWSGPVWFRAGRSIDNILLMSAVAIEKLSSEDSNFGTQDRFVARVISRVNKRSATGIKRHDRDLDDH